VPDFFSKNTPIDKDEHFIKIYYATPENATSPKLYDVIHIVSTGWKVNVSTGFFISGLGDQMFAKKSMDSIYHKQYVAPGGQVHDTVVNQSFTSINKQKQASLSYGAMVYINAHTQTYNNVNYGLALGFGAMFNDQARWVASLGPTMLIGKKQRFNINPAIMIGQVDRLSAPYQAGKWYAETIDNVPTFKAWKVSWGIGFSWNL
jgi:hypothetical protein